MYIPTKKAQTIKENQDHPTNSSYNHKLAPQNTKQKTKKVTSKHTKMCTHKLNVYFLNIY